MKIPRSVERAPAPAAAGAPGAGPSVDLPGEWRTLAAVVRVVRFASPFAGLVFFGLALWALYWSLRDFHYRQMVETLGALPTARIASALGLTAAGYLVLTGYDVLGFRYAGRIVPLRPVALASFIANAFGNTVGKTLITGAAVRYWI
jgi:phosphatidylglycerol lysyltransferase